ncbi:MAG: hypothetical protein GY847_01725 [Proteobacteria bacterium]|nr:hypothetical protein [Pseudomonadota bacterium]
MKGSEPNWRREDTPGDAGARWGPEQKRAGNGLIRREVMGMGNDQICQEAEVD